MALYPDYCTLAEARDHLRITNVADTGDDDNIALAITAASRAVDLCCSGASVNGIERQFGLTTQASRKYTPFYSETFGWWVCEIDDTFSSVFNVFADLDNDGTYEQAVTDFTLWPYNAAAEGWPYTAMVFGYDATLNEEIGALQCDITVGWTTVPSVIKQATLIQMARFYKRRDAPFGIAGSSLMGGSDTRLLARADPDVQVMLRRYRRATIS